MVSSIIDGDPDSFDPTDGGNTGANPSGASGETEASSNNTTSSTSTVLTVETVQPSQSQSSMILKSAGPYQNLSEGARALDLMMYSVLITNVIGSKHVILECTNKPSYIQGMCLLYYTLHKSPDCPFFLALHEGISTQSREGFREF